MPKPYLLIIHHEPEEIGLIGAHLKNSGAPVLIRRPNRGDPLPEPRDVRGAVIFGGEMSANDDHDPGISAELKWTERAVRRGTPLLGVCLGAQMIARVHGAKVAPRKDGLWEIGYREVTPTAAAGDFLSAPTSFLQWHGEGFDLPSGAVLLGSGALFPNQAFRIGPRIHAIQFHPEVTAKRLRYFHAKFAAEMRKPGGDPLSRQSLDDLRHRAAVEAWLESFLSKWSAIEAEPA